MDRAFKGGVFMNVRSFSIFLFAISYAVIAFGTAAVKAADNSGNHKSKEAWTFRVITEKELERVFQKDMDLRPVSA